jgi:hypothetical protein
MPINIANTVHESAYANNLGYVRYIPAFDGLRAICIFFVIAFHVVSSDHFWLQDIARRGWCGVDIFFVLSGFLITWVLIAEQDKTDTINLPRFYMRRAMRLQPAYFSGLFAFSLLLFLFHRAKFSVIAYALPYFLTYSLNLGLAFGFLGPSLRASMVALHRGTVLSMLALVAAAFWCSKITASHALYHRLRRSLSLHGLYVLELDPPGSPFNGVA